MFKYKKELIESIKNLNPQFNDYNELAKQWSVGKYQINKGITELNLDERPFFECGEIFDKFNNIRSNDVFDRLGIGVKSGDMVALVFDGKLEVGIINKLEPSKLENVTLLEYIDLSSGKYLHTYSPNFTDEVIDVITDYGVVHITSSCEIILVNK